MKADGATDKIDVSKIAPNPQNPRSLISSVGIEDDDFDRLKDSIREHGLLVPVVVRRLSKSEDGKEYQLIDGERRVLACIEVRLKKIPAYILSSVNQDAAVRELMFHIHSNRKQWTPANKLKALRNSFHDKARKLSSKPLKKSSKIIDTIRRQYGMDTTEARTIVCVLRWPKEDLDRLDKNHKLFNHLAQIEARVITLTLENYGQFFDRFTPDNVRNSLLGKLQSGKFSRATDVRESGLIFEKKKNKVTDRKKVLKILNDLVESKSYTFEQAVGDYLRQFPAERPNDLPRPRKLYNIITDLSETLEAYDLALFDSQPEKGPRITKRKFVEGCTNLKKHLQHTVKQIKV